MPKIEGFYLFIFKKMMLGSMPTFTTTAQLVSRRAGKKEFITRVLFAFVCGFSTSLDSILFSF